jgi:hypothetical protein
VVRAIELTHAMLNGRLRRLERIEAGLADWCAKRRLDAAQRRDILRFVDGVHTWIRANINWST